VDFYFRSQGVSGESDGYGKYDATDVAKAKAHFVAEKRREDRLRRHERGFLRWEMSDAMHPNRLDEKLRAVGLRPIRSRQTAMLASLRSNPRSLQIVSGRAA
jgi:hypothetical protein